MQFRNIPLVLALASSVLATCDTGVDKDTYQAGFDQAQAQYAAAWSFVYEKCSSRQEIYDQIEAAGPGDSAPPCQKEGFEAGLEASAQAAEDECPQTPEGCSNEDTYRNGMKQAEVQWDASFKYLGCDKIDDVMQITSESGPTEPPCYQMGFQDQLYLSYTAAGEECGGTTCQSRGEDLASEHWQKTIDSIGSDCASADQALTQCLAAAPATPQCLYDAYTSKVQALYDEKFDDCIEECQGNGKEYGERLGSQFCALTALYSSDESDDPFVLVICDMEEVSACEESMDAYVSKHCGEVRDDDANDKYYSDLEAGCVITIGPDQPKPKPEPSKKPEPCDSEEGKALGEDAWTQARRQVGDTCHDIDEALATCTEEAPPTSDACIYASYMDAVNDLYEKAQETCINECEGYGETKGMNAADQFCRVSELYADDASDEGITIYVCNEKEKKACYDSFNEHVEAFDGCAERVENADDKTQQFYEDVQQVCEVTIGPDQ